MHTELIDRKKMRGSMGSDCRLIEHHPQPVTTLGHVDCEVVAGWSSVTRTALLAHPSSPPWVQSQFILAGAADGWGYRLSPQLSQEAVALAAEGTTASTA